MASIDLEAIRCARRALPGNVYDMLEPRPNFSKEAPAGVFATVLDQYRRFRAGVEGGGVTGDGRRETAPDRKLVEPQP